jgi:hypothetical protein
MFPLVSPTENPWVYISDSLIRAAINLQSGCPLLKEITRLIRAAEIPLRTTISHERISAKFFFISTAICAAVASLRNQGGGCSAIDLILCNISLLPHLTDCQKREAPGSPQPAARQSIRHYRRSSSKETSQSFKQPHHQQKEERNRSSQVRKPQPPRQTRKAKKTGGGKQKKKLDRQ